MKISKQLAEKYVSYRSRYLNGSDGLYSKESSICSDFSNVTPLRNGQHVSFLSRNESSASEIGSFLHLDKAGITESGVDASSLESGDINSVSYGDNLIYCSFAAMNFAAEYRITQQLEPLLILLNIIRSFQRLGSYQSGLNEPLGEFYGYMLRSDSPDTEAEENICVWLKDHEKARNLEPSYDQYCGLISSLRIIQIILNEAPQKVEHLGVLKEIDAAIKERVVKSILYLGKSFWTILWMNSDGMPQIAKRGPFCLHAAYPFAKVASFVAGNNFADYFLGDFPFASLPTINESSELNTLKIATTEGMIKEFPVKMNGFLMKVLIDDVMENALGDALNEVAHMVGGGNILRDKIEEQINSILHIKEVINGLIKIVLNKIISWSGIASGIAAIPFSIFLHRYYSKFMLQRLEDNIFMTFGDMLALMGIEKPENPTFNLDFSISFSTPEAPDWWPRDPFPPHDPIGWKKWEREYSISKKLEIPLDPIWAIPVPIGILDPLGVLVSSVAGGLDQKPDLQMLVFICNVAADTFKENLINPVSTSFELQNAFMMALTYRVFPSFFEGEANHANLTKFRNVMDRLNDAPSIFPKGRIEVVPWNQNFRWMRGEKSEDSNDIYSGLDFMLPLILACSKQSDLEYNRSVLLDCLSPVVKDLDQMSSFKLPFQGPKDNFNVVEPRPGGTTNGSKLFIGVVFERTRGEGEVQLTITNLNGNTEDLIFKQNDPSRMIAIPFTDKPIIAKLINRYAKGYFIIDTSD
jgi:hypothetical protein